MSNSAIAYCIGVSRWYAGYIRTEGAAPSQKLDLLGAGCDMTTIAALLGDSVAVAEKHYADLASARMRERLATVPVRTW